MKQVQHYFRVSKNAVLAHYFLPDFRTPAKLTKMPVNHGYRADKRGPKSGQRKSTNLDALALFITDNWEVLAYEKWKGNLLQIKNHAHFEGYLKVSNQAVPII